MFYDIYIAIISFMELGGNVLWLIAALTFLMWTLIFERAWYFMFEHRRDLSQSSEAWEARPERRSWSAHQIRQGLVSQASDKITGSFPLILTCVALCPLLGLLGTVTGMIAVFEAMAVHGGNARSMAAGVSQATIPTMAGMIAGLSGIFATTFLKQRIDFEIELFEDHLTMDH
jgi:biopolymer transport protein ExbB